MAYPVQNIERQLALGKQQNGVVIREPSTALFGINSLDRYANYSVNVNSQRYNNPTSPYAFTIQKSQVLAPGLFTRFGVTECAFNWTIPTITARNCAIGLQYSPGGFGVGVTTGYTIQVPFGWYTASNLASTLQTLIRAASTNSSFTVTVDAVSGAFTFATTNADCFTLSPAQSFGATYTTAGLYSMLNLGPNTFAQNIQVLTASSNAASTVDFFLNSTEGFAVNGKVTTTGFSPAGFNVTSATITAIGTAAGTGQPYIRVTASATSFASTVGVINVAGTPLTIQQGGVPQMLSTKFVDIVCTQLTGDQGVKDCSTAQSVRDVLCRMYLDNGLNTSPQTLGTTPFTTHRAFPFPKQIKWLGQRNVGNLLFEVYDDRGNLLTTGEPTASGYTTQFTDVMQGDFQLTLLMSEN